MNSKQLVIENVLENCINRQNMLSFQCKLFYSWPFTSMNENGQSYWTKAQLTRSMLINSPYKYCPIFQGEFLCIEISLIEIPPSLEGSYWEIDSSRCFNFPFIQIVSTVSTWGPSQKTNETMCQNIPLFALLFMAKKRLLV